MAKVNLDKINASFHGNLESVVATTDLHNGAIIALGERVEGQLEQMTAVAPAADKELLLVAAPELKYDERQDRLDMVTKAGDTVRAYHLVSGDIFRVETKLFAAPPKKGDVVTGAANHGYEVVGAEGAVTKFVVESVGRYLNADMARLRVI